MKQIHHHLRIHLNPLMKSGCRRGQQCAVGPGSKAQRTSRRFLQDDELAHRFALSYGANPFFAPAGVGQKCFELAFDHNPKLGDLVAGRRQRLLRHEGSHLNLAGDG